MDKYIIQPNLKKNRTLTDKGTYTSPNTLKVVEPWIALNWMSLWDHTVGEGVEMDCLRLVIVSQT